MKAIYYKGREITHDGAAFYIDNVKVQIRFKAGMLYKMNYKSISTSLLPGDLFERMVTGIEKHDGIYETLANALIRIADRQ